MILLIDNYDSFVFNLARYFGQLGHKRTVVRNDEITLDDIAELNPSHIVLSPGPCSPTEAGICVSLIQRFYQVTPILGICLGHQAIGQAFGATITRAKHPMHGKSSLIQHTQNHIFTNLPIPLQVARYHSLVVDEHNFPRELTILSQDTQGEIMALCHKHFPCVGVQFHPESVLSHHGHALLNNFLTLPTLDTAFTISTN